MTTWISGHNAPGCLPDTTEPPVPADWHEARDQLISDLEWAYDAEEDEARCESLAVAQEFVRLLPSDSSVAVEAAGEMWFLESVAEEVPAPCDISPAQE
jgi:hypothetical protein